MHFRDTCAGLPRRQLFTALGLLLAGLALGAAALAASLSTDTRVLAARDRAELRTCAL